MNTETYSEETFEMRKATVSDLIEFAYNREKNLIDNQMMTCKAEIKARLMNIREFINGNGDLNVGDEFNKIYEARKRMNGIHMNRNALSETFSEMYDLGFVNATDDEKKEVSTDALFNN